MLRRKSIVLSDTDSQSNKKAVLSLEEKTDGVEGMLRLYNFQNNLPGVSSLGFYVDKNVYKAGLTYKSHMLYEFFIDLKTIPQKFSCAVVNFQNAEAKPILYGSSEGSGEQVYGSIISEIAKDSSYSHTKQVLDNYGVEFDREEQEEIDKAIDKEICQSCDNCANCVYKKYFFEHQDKTEKIMSIDEKEEVELPKKEEEIENFFIDKLKPQIDKLFENNPTESSLQNIIPSSKWVKVDYEDDGDFYVFGLLYDDRENVKYICYGVPAVFEEEPPKELSGFPIWLPLDSSNAKGFGYWLTYQDAVTGEPVKAIIE